MHSSLSNVVADQVRRHRERLGMTREELAERCSRLGYPEITYAAITNIERKNKAETKRRRDVTVDELMILAYALAVPPLLLVFPLGAVDQVNIPPRNNAMGPWWAWKWAAGMEPPGMRSDRGMVALAYGAINKDGLDIEDAWRMASYPVQMYRELEDATDAVRAATSERNFARTGYGEDSDEYRKATTARLEAFRGLAQVLNKMMRAGVKVPAYTRDWADELKALDVLERPNALPILTEDGAIVRGGDGQQ